MIQEKYTYKNIPIPGGGYVTGFMFDESEEGRLFLRTDIGGAYRWEKEERCWKSLINHVTMKDLRETYPIALAAEDGFLYIVSGVWGKKEAKLSVSEDNGASFTHYELPFMAHGNLNGRGTGSRLFVEKNAQGGETKKLWFASQTQGLWSCEGVGQEWQKCIAMQEDYLTFVAGSPDGRAIIVGSAGVTTCKSENMRGAALWISYDEGVSFTELEQPENVKLPETLMSGHVPQRYAFDDRFMYVTFQAMGPNATRKELGYSCDNGSVWCGKIYRYSLEDFSATDITPKVEADDNGLNPMDSGGTFGRKAWLIKENNLDVLSYGISGISACKAKPGLLAASTLSKEDGDCVFRSVDYGESWEIVLHDLDTGVMDFRTEYMKPRYNGGHNLIHWMSDIKINPYKPEEVWFNTGTGPFCSRNFLDAEVHFSDWADGIEETVHINVYSPHDGDVKVLDIVGDLGGFAFKDLDKPCDNSFADSEGNRYITCLNADYSDIDPKCIIVSARGNWTGKTTGGLIMSEDQGDSFERLDSPFGLSDKLDKLFEKIEKPNVNPGWVAMSPGCNNIVWSVCDVIYLPADCVVVSNDGGYSFTKANIFDLEGNCVSDKVMPDFGEIMKILGVRGAKPENADRRRDIYGFKAFSDRLKDDVFYGFGVNGEFYVSTDGGQNFYQKSLGCDAFDMVNFAFVDTINKMDVRCDNGKSGVFYISIREGGLWKLIYSVSDDTVTMKKLTADGDCVYRVGLGVGRPGGDYLTEDKAIYMAAEIGGEYGFYRTVDEGSSFVRINADDQMYGEINSCCADAREFGRFYIATGSRGLLYGDRV